MDFFLSYIHDYQGLAGKIKTELEKSGNSGFLAHKDINVSETWREEILKQLDACSGLIAIVTPGFELSSWTNQEVGVALGKGKPVFPLAFKVGLDSLPGFLESLQGIPISDDTIETAINRILGMIAPSGAALPTALQPELVDALLEKVGWPYRRIFIRPEIIQSELISTSPENDSWLYTARPPAMMFGPPKPSQHGTLFPTPGRNAFHVEVRKSGEIYYGECIEPSEAGVHIGKTIKVIGRMLEYAVQVYQHFNYQRTVLVEFKLGQISDMELTAEPTRSLSEHYRSQQGEVIVSRRIGIQALSTDLNSYVASMTVEFCRSFGLALDIKVAAEYVNQMLSGR